MIITLTGATFSNNINSSMGARYSITYVCKANEDGSTLTPYYNGKTSVGENETVTFNSSNTPRVNGYSFLSATPAKIENPTGPVTVEVKYEKVESDAPIAPPSTSYTFTINPNPTSATVTLTATGYSTVSGTGSKSITVANGTTVNWSVSASGYTTRTGNWTINGGNKTENITLSASSGDVGATYYFKDQTNEGYLRGGEFVPSTKSATTDYIDISSKPKIGYYGRMGFVSGETFHALEFYDANKNYLADLSVLGTGVPMQTNIDLSESKYANAKYVRASVSQSSYSQEEFNKWYFTVGSFIAEGPTLDTLKTMFPEDGYLSIDGALVTGTSGGNAYTTDYISLSGKTNIEYKGRMGTIGLNIAFYDSSKQLISGLETVGDGKFITLNINLSDAKYANAAYVRASISKGNLDETTWLSSSFKIS